MRTSETPTLPAAEQAYTIINEQGFRRTLEQVLQDLRLDIVDNRNYTDKPASLAFRRQQFLLMGS